MISLSAITIWYNPQTMQNPTASEAILSYSSRMDKVYIIDNSSNNNSSLINNIPNAVYIPNYKNLGIAKALNQGCEAAKQDGFDWVLTMDQDSFFEETQLNKFISIFNDFTLSDNSIKSFAPTQLDSGNSNIVITKQVIKNIISFFLPHYLEKREQKKLDVPDTVFVDRIMTSANIINLNTWAEIGRFDEILFIDEVDHDFCTRLVFSNYKILKINTCHVNHRLGEPTKTFFPKVQYESDFRLFYIFRNMMIEKYRYGKQNKVRNYSKEIWEYFRDYCIFNRHPITHLKIFLKAYKDYKKIITKA